MEKTVVETISMAMIDSSDVLCFDLINISVKSTKVERCTDVMFKFTLYLSVTVEDLEDLRYEDKNILGAQYFVVLHSTLGAQWSHDTRVRLIFLP